MRDNPRNEEAGWSYIEDDRNDWPVDGSTWIHDQIGRSQQLQRRFIKDSDQVEWKQQEIERYLGQVAVFRGNLLVLMHMTGGQPARAPEILSIQRCNSRQGRRRNVFVEQNSPFSEEGGRLNEEALIVFVARWHKGYTLTGKEKIIHRCLPRAVGELFVYFDWLVRPFQEELEGIMVKGPQAGFSTAVWPPDDRGRVWDTARMTRHMQECSRRLMGVQFGTQAWRELAIGISRRFLREEYAFDWDAQDEEGDFDVQATCKTSRQGTGRGWQATCTRVG